jgi:hypothetical protein
MSTFIVSPLQTKGKTFSARMRMMASRGSFRRRFLLMITASTFDEGHRRFDQLEDIRADEFKKN